MPRPNKSRKIFSNPGVFHFKPVGRNIKEYDEVELTIDEFEAIRLADYEGLYQEKAAEQMNVSRQTFGNIVNSAHKKIADFLINAKSLKISGGSIEMITDNSNFICFGCKILQNSPDEIGKIDICPYCISPELHRLKDEYIQKENEKIEKQIS
jgi:predicted DNA-binding protein (UPF0251 family)